MAEASPIQAERPNLTMIRQRAVTLGLKALSHRLLAFMSLALMACAFAWVMYDPGVLRLIAAGIFGLFDLFIFYQAMKAGE